MTNEQRTHKPLTHSIFHNLIYNRVHGIVTINLHVQRDIILHSITESLLCTKSKAITAHIKTKSANAKQGSAKHVKLTKNMKINKSLCFVDRASYYNLCKWPTWRTIVFRTFVYSSSLHVSSNQVLIIRRVNCINFEKYPKIIFHENPCGGSRTVPCGRTDGQTDMTWHQV